MMPTELTTCYVFVLLQVIGNVFDSSNWVDHTYPSALYLCIKYLQEPELALKISVNLGGDSSNRTALIGAIMGDTAFDCFPCVFIIIR